jgi:hypothetical protein
LERFTLRRHALIGASEDDDLGPSSGSAYVFIRDLATWTQEAKLLPADGSAYDNFGNAVALTDSFAVVAAQLDDQVAANAGAVCIFSRTGDNWIETARIVADDGAEEDHFGSSVSLAGDLLVVGCSLDDDRGVNAGSAYVFRRTGDLWAQEAKLLAVDGETDDNSGLMKSSRLGCTM